MYTAYDSLFRCLAFATTTRALLPLNRINEIRLAVVIRFLFFILLSV